jgi:hypothetical protein
VELPCELLPRGDGTLEFRESTTREAFPRFWKRARDRGTSKGGLPRRRPSPYRYALWNSSIFRTTSRI